MLQTGDNGWRPLPGTSDRPVFSKEAVGHPVLDKLKAHIEAAEKQQLIYTPPPPTILGSFSAVSRPRKEVYSARLVPPPPPHLDLQTAQQQQHAFFLAPPTHTLLPPPRSSDFLVDNGYFNQQRFPAVGHLQFFPQLKPGVQEAFSVLPQHQYREPLQQAHPQIGLGQQEFGSIFRQAETTSTASPHGNNQGPTRDQNFYVTPPVTGHRFETKRPALPNIFSEPQIIQGQVTSSRFPQTPTYQQLYNTGQSGHTERNPNSATSVVGFTLGVSPDNQVSTKTTIQHRPQGPAEVDLIHGQRTRVTRPYFGEDGPTASIPQQRPQVTDSDVQSLLSTVPPVPQAFLRKPPQTEQPTQISDDNDRRRPSHRPRRPPQRPVLEIENSYGDQAVTSRPRRPSQQQHMIFVTALSDDYPVTPTSVQYSQSDVTETYSQQTRHPTNQRPNADFQNVNTEQQSVDFYGKTETPSRPLKRPGMKKRPQIVSNSHDGYQEQSTYQEAKPVQDHRSNNQFPGTGSSSDQPQYQDDNIGQISQSHKPVSEYQNVLDDLNSHQFGKDQNIRLQETVTSDQRIVDDQSRYHDGKIIQTDRPYQQFSKDQSDLGEQTQHQPEKVGSRMRPSETVSDNLEEQPQFQNERKRYKTRRPQYQLAHSAIGNEEVKPSTEYLHNLPTGNNEIRTRKRRPKPPVKNQEDSTLHNNVHHEDVTQVTGFENPENLIQTSSYETQPIQEHRKYRRPIISKPQFEHTTPIDVYDNQDKPQRHRRPLTHKRVRPTEEIQVKDYENQEVGTQSQPEHEYNEGQTSNYENHDISYRKRLKHPQRVKETSSVVDGIAESEYTPHYSTAETVATTMSSPAYRPRQNLYNRNRGKEKYQRKPLNERTTTRQPETSQQLALEESFPATEPEIPNDLTDESPSLTHTSVTEQNYGFTSQDDEENDVPVTTTEALTTTTIPTTTTSTTPIPHVSSSLTTINRLRPKLRYGSSNYTRPRFSVKDYRERLKQSSTTKPGDENDALDSSITEAPSSERSRTPRPRGSYHYKPHRTDDVDQSDAPKLPKYRPKDLSRFNSARFRSTTTTTAPYTTEKTESGYKSSTSRYRRPVTGKYNSHYKASTEQSATSRMDEDFPPETASTTSRPVYRPKGVFSAAMRRPFPLRTSNSPPTEATADNAIAESDGSHTVSKMDSSGDEEVGITAVAPSSIYGTKTNLDIVTTTTPTEVSKADPTPSSSPSVELPTEQSSPSHNEATTTLDLSSTSTDSVWPQTSSVVPVMIEADVGTEIHQEEASTPWNEDGLSPSQRVADLTSSATLGGYFQTSSNTNIKNSLRITMATEDPILPLEAFFPSWGNKDSEPSR